MIFIEAAEDEQILQYYTIVDEDTSSLVPVQQQLLLTGDDDEDDSQEQIAWKPYVFVSVAPDEPQQIDENVNNNEDTPADDADNTTTNLKLITLADGRMFVMDDNAGKNNCSFTATKKALNNVNFPQKQVLVTFSNNNHNRWC